MISGYSIGKFQAIGETQHVPIKPITLIFGPNGAGKSSLLKSLLVAQQAIQTNSISKNEASHPMHPGTFEDYARFRKHPFPEDFFPGDYEDDCYYPNSSNRVQFIFSASESDGFGKLVNLSVEIEFGNYGENCTTQLSILKNGKCVIQWVPAGDGCLIVKHIDAEEFPDIDCLNADRLKGLGIMKESLKLPVLGFLPKELFGGDSGHSAGSAYLKGLMEGLSGFLNEDADSQVIHNKVRLLRDEIREAQQSIIPKLRGIIAGLYRKVTEAVEATFKPMIYHGPLRPIAPSFFDVGADKTHDLRAWKQVAAEPEIQSKINEWLSSTAFRQKYRIEFDRLILDSNLDQLASIIDDLRLEEALPRWGSLHYVDQNPHSLPLGYSELMEEEMAKAKVKGKGKDETDAQYFDEDDASTEISRRFWHDCYVLFEKAHAEGGSQEFAMGAMKELASQLGRRLRDARHRTHSNYVRVNLVDVTTGLKVSPNNTGVGFSQMLPILASAYGSEKSLIVVEQPELHIHPALQAELADVFIESALGPNQNRLLLETHSEHLILRVLRRIRETSAGNLDPDQIGIRPEDIAILYVKPGKEGSEVVELAVTPDGDFSDPWPDGFFPDRAKELF